MLRVLRENVKYLSWILWVIIGLFVLFVFVDFGTGLRGRDQVSWAAKVGNMTVSQAEFLRAQAKLDSRMRQAYGEQYTPEIAKQMQLPMQALNQVVSDKILLREAARIGLRVSDADVREEILSIPAFKDEKGNFIGDAQYAQILQSNHFTISGFEEEVREDLLKRKLTDALSADLYISDSEIEKTYRDQVERAKVRYVEMPRQRFADVAVTPAEVSAYFQQHRSEYQLPEQRDGGYLLIEPTRLLDQVQIADADLQGYYKDHQDEFKQDAQVRASHILLLINEKRNDAQARQQIDDIKKRIEKGEDFAAVARQVSEDPSSKPNGGDLGFFSHGRMVKEFEDAAFAAEPNKLVGPIKSPFGYHLLEVTGRRAGGVQPFDEVRTMIRSRLAFEKARQLAETKAKDLASKLSSQKPKSLQDLQAAAKDPGVTYTATGKFSQQEPVPGLGLAQPFNAAVFGAKKGDVTAAVEVPRGWAVAWVQGIYPGHLAEQGEVEGKVRAALSTRKQQEKAIERLTAARQEVQQGKSLDQVAAELGVKVVESAEFGSSGSIPGLGSSPQLAKLAMTLPVGQLGGPVADANGAVLFQVTDRKSWEPAKFAAAKDQTRKSLQQQRLGSFLGALVERRKRELGVDYNRTLLKSLDVAVDGQPQAG
jgi:peptidyl-prolyl cis-trans isomerase D